MRPTEDVSDVGMLLWKKEYTPKGSRWVEEEER